MTHYRTNDGQVLSGGTPQEVVRELHKISYAPAEDDRAFMRATADRVSAQTGRQVRSYNAVVFVEDLLAAGLLVTEEDA